MRKMFESSRPAFRKSLGRRGLTPSLFWALLAPALILGPAHADDEMSYVEVLSVSGKAEVMDAGGASWENAVVDMKLHSGGKIKTAADSYLEIAFDEDKISRINENSEVVILMNGDEKIEIIDGEVYSTIKNLPAGSSFIVRTPTCVAGARGTDWLTKVSSGATEVEAYDDSPFTYTIDSNGARISAETFIKPGYRSVVARFKEPTVPVRFSEARMKAWQKIKTDMRPRIEKAAQARKQNGARLGGDKAFVPVKRKEEARPVNGGGRKTQAEPVNGGNRKTQVKPVNCDNMPVRIFEKQKQQETRVDNRGAKNTEKQNKRKKGADTQVTKSANNTGPANNAPRKIVSKPIIRKNEPVRISRPEKTVQRKPASPRGRQIKR